MPKEGSQHKVNDDGALFLTENEDAVWWSLALMSYKNLLEHLDSSLWLQLFLDHCV